MDNITYPDELQHWGIKGQRWGVRRYQNKDGSLTPAGQKRYNQEMEKLKKEEAKIKEQTRIAANRKKTQAKIDSLEDRKKALAEQKKKLKDGDDPDVKKKEETLEEKRERLLKSTDAKELYKNKDILTNQEINARIDRIDTEAKLNSRIAVEKQETGRDKVNKWMDNTAESINKATNLYKKVDDAYSTVTKSAIGKTLAKKLGLDIEEEKSWDWKDFAKNINKKSSQEIAEASKRALNEKNIKKHVEGMEEAEQAAKDAKKAEKEASENFKKAQKQVDEYNERWQRGETDDINTTYSRKGSDLNNHGKDDISDGRKHEVTIYDNGESYATTSPILKRSTSSFDSDTYSSGKSYVDNSDILEGKIVTDSDGNVRIIYDDDVRHSSTNSDELYHYGVKGMKWGQHIFGKEQTSSGAKSSTKKKKDDNSGTEFDEGIKKGFTRNQYGWINPVEITTNVGTAKNVRVNLEVGKYDSTTRTVKVADDVPERAKKAQKLIKKYDDDGVKEIIAKDIYDQYNWDENLTRNEFKKRIKLISLWVNDGTYEAYYDDDGTYRGHVFCVEGAAETGKAVRVSMEG